MIRRNGTRGRNPGFRRSLLSRYLLIIVIAVLFLPVIFPLSLIIYTLSDHYHWTSGNTADETKKAFKPYSNIAELEKMWHKEARLLAGKSDREIGARLKALGDRYQYASMFWVNGEGMTRLALPPEKKSGSEAGADNGATGGTDNGATGRTDGTDIGAAVPARWTALQAIAFMKDSVGSDPLTVVAFIGDRADAGEGFMAMRVPKSVLPRNTGSVPLALYGLMLLVLLAFAAISWLFFAGIRGRLLRLQTAMTLDGRDGLPAAIPKGKPDEIGMLEEAFNTMVAELKDSRRREREEEELRKRLIADLSHDLRTPLTVVRSHLFQVGKEPLSPQGKESLNLMDERIADLGVLIDNLLNYNLLASGRVKLSPGRQDVLRLLRESAAAWYPVWTKEGMEVDIELEGEPLVWEVDEIWFRRVLDNLYQNVVRHAKGGGYVGVAAEDRGGVRTVVIRDRGKGLGEASPAKGAGIGLAIVDMLLSRMGLAWTADSDPEGTSVCIYPKDRG
ncbi:HAMP domain-containing sensor histidine kinase [Paenibacillus rhizophilus]|uniref:histidine kinase n=1 Tax=Paenibacillus rhizophilus TaxID=1850366 RepID=A0A3N9P430_9BACL|nr:HAMP domain-containing sensor histidine kinase [Paenibacillus rhizophilus]RQW10961.1 sensor histidine kinase [Paenibacillus rhizophilus]